MVTTWNTRCGVAENTRNIVDRAEAQVAIDIFANIDPEIIDPSRELGVHRNWIDRWHPDLGALGGASPVRCRRRPPPIQFRFLRAQQAGAIDRAGARDPWCRHHPPPDEGRHNRRRSGEPLVDQGYSRASRSADRPPGRRVARPRGHGALGERLRGATRCVGTACHLVRPRRGPRWDSGPDRWSGRSGSSCPTREHSSSFEP